MRFRVALALACLVALIPLRAHGQSVAPTHTWAGPVHTVSADRYSLMVDGHRILLYAGEFHYWREPARGLWESTLEKMKAGGLNAVSIYFDWAYHSPSPGVYDFTGPRDIDYLLSLADHLGLYVLARIGPYMNAEADAGGFPGWLLRTGAALRDETWDGKTVAAADGTPAGQLYLMYAREWYDHLLPIIARHQVTGGGSVIAVQIENELNPQGASVAYMQQLYAWARADGIAVPILHNDWYLHGSWQGLVDLYGFDSYPYGFSCCPPWGNGTFSSVDGWEADARARYGLTTPLMVTELQGGMYDPWGGGGFSRVARTLDGGFLTCLDASALAQGATVLSRYMFAGGTNWGYQSYPGAYTSYDYGAPLSEAGLPEPSFYASKNLGTFIQTFNDDLAQTDAAPAVVAPLQGAAPLPSGLYEAARVNPTTGATFIFLRHADSGPAWNLHVPVTVGAGTPGAQPLSIPVAQGTSLTLPGHSAMILLAHANLDGWPLAWTTSQIFTHVQDGTREIVALSGAKGSDGETALSIPPASGTPPYTLSTLDRDIGVSFDPTTNILRFNYRYAAAPRTVVVTLPDGRSLQLIIDSDLTRFWRVGNEIVTGPDLVTEHNGALRLETHRTVSVHIFGAPAGATTLDSTRIRLHRRRLRDEEWFTLPGPRQRLALPSLRSWRFATESPEIAPGFDDSGWQLADHPSTANPNVPSTDSLLADDYGFHYGFVWYRGSFVATGHESVLTVAARQSYSVWLDGTYLGSHDEALGNEPQPPYAHPTAFAIPPNLVGGAGGSHVIAILTESLGHDEGWAAGPQAASPQGVLSAQLDTGQPITWRIQGDAGGEVPADSLRGLMNASGLYGERMGWYLPGYDDSSWQNVTLPDDWAARVLPGQSQPGYEGVGWYRTTVALHLPSHLDAPLGLYISRASDKAVIFVNGWNIGRYWQQMGPQHLFYLPQGILNVHGTNVIAIAVWNRGHDGGLTGPVRLQPYDVLSLHRFSLPVSP